MSTQTMDRRIRSIPESRRAFLHADAVKVERDRAGRHRTAEMKDEVATMFFFIVVPLVATGIGDRR